jgi:type VI secretion system protein VasG
LKENHRASLRFDEDVVASIAGRCREVESGARNVDHILTRSLLPEMSQEVLTRMAEGVATAGVHVAVDDRGNFRCTIS